MLLAQAANTLLQQLAVLAVLRELLAWHHDRQQHPRELWIAILILMQAYARCALCME